MHELSLIENMLDQLWEMKKKYDLRNITDVHVSVGAMAGVDEGFLRSSFEMFVPQTEWSQLKMHLTTIPWKVRCEDCHLEQEIRDFENRCDRCGSQNTVTIEGTEFLIQRIEGEQNV